MHELVRCKESLSAMGPRARLKAIEDTMIGMNDIDETWMAFPDISRAVEEYYGA